MSIFLVFFSFFFTDYSQGKLSLSTLASDEIQILVLMGVAASSALVGTFLVLRKMTMLANALSHTILLGIVLAFLISMALLPKPDPYQTLTIPILLLSAFLTGIFTTFLTEFLTRVIKLQEDASVGLVFTALFALGIVCVTIFSKNVHIGTELIMGNVDALKIGDISIVMTILIFNSFLFLFLFNGYKITTFDPGLAKAFGYFPQLFNYLLMIQTSATAISAFKAVGVLMVLAFLVIPVLTARLLTHTLTKLIWLSMGIGCFGAIVGVAISRHLLTSLGIGLSTGGIVVTLLGIFYLLAALFAPKRGIILQIIWKKSFLKRTEEVAPVDQ